MELAGQPRLALICGRYEGVDERIREHLVTDEISIGDYVLTGGELPALILIDALARLLPGVLGDPDGAIRRLARLRPARIPALHPPARIPRLDGARDPALRRPCQDRALAARTIPAADAGSAARTCWKTLHLNEKDQEISRKTKSSSENTQIHDKGETSMEKKRFPWGRTFLMGFGFLGISIIWPIFNQYIPLFLQAGNPEFERQLLAEGRELPKIVGFGLAPSLAMFIMTWDNLINMFIAPWAGSASDRTWNKLGRRKMWILIGAPIALLAFVFIPVAQTVLAILVFILITNFGMALFRSPTVSWLGDLFDRDDRSKANGVINLMGGVGGLLAYFGSGMIFNAFESFSPQTARLMPFLAGAIVTAIALVTVLIFVKEPRTLPGGEDQEKANVLKNVRILFSNPDKSGVFVLLSILFWFMAFNALETGLSSFAVFSLGMRPGTASIYAGLVTISFIIFSIPAGFLGTRFGRGPIIRIGLIGLICLLLFGYFFVQRNDSLRRCTDPDGRVLGAGQCQQPAAGL